MTPRRHLREAGWRQAQAAATVSAASASAPTTSLALETQPAGATLNNSSKPLSPRTSPPERPLSPSLGLICVPLPFCPLSPPSSPPTPSSSPRDLRPSLRPPPLIGSLLRPVAPADREARDRVSSRESACRTRGLQCPASPRGWLSPPAVWTDCTDSADSCGHPPSCLRLPFCPSAQVCGVWVGARLCGPSGAALTLSSQRLAATQFWT